jgi:uncharacterized protein DUF6308
MRRARSPSSGEDVRAGVAALTYDDRVTANSFPPVVLRNGVAIEDPLSVVLGFLKAPRRWDVSDPSRPASFGEPDLRLANRAGARISAAQIAAILERRGAIEHVLQAIAADASLAGTADSVPWLPLRQLFDAFSGLRGVGFSKMTKALHPKRPALIPLLDSIVLGYLQDDDLGAQAPFAERGLGLVRGYQRDLDRNQAAVRAVRQELARRRYRLTEVRILDLLILSAVTAARPARPGTNRALPEGDTMTTAVISATGRYTTGTFGQITGRPPRPAAEFLHEYRAEFL